MDEIRKYSREWFITNSSSKAKESAKNLKNGAENKVDGSLNRGVFNGDKEDVKGWLEIVKNGAETERLIKEYGGFDNIFALIDTDEDGVIDDDEISAMAGVDTPEDEERLDKKFTTKDLQMIYDNVMAVDSAKVEETENKKTYKYNDGSKTEVEYDKDGNIQKTTSYKSDEDGKIVRKTYDKDGKLLEVDTGDGNKQGITEQNGLKVKNFTDDKGRIIKTVTEGKTEKDKKTVDTEYHNDGSKTVTTDTIGRHIVEKYDKNEKLISKDIVYKYESDMGGLDGVIEDTYQGTAGDCWLLAGVNSVAQTPAGKEMIKNAIHKNDDGSVTITLKGVDRSYTYTPEELVSYDYASSPMATATGDLDMNLIERAVSEYRRELLSKPEAEIPRSMKQATKRDPLNAGTGEESMFYLTGKKGYTTGDTNKIKQDIDKFAQKPDNYGIVVNFKQGDPDIYSHEAAEMGTREDAVEIISNHAYTVSRVDDKNVYVRDPKDSYWEIKYPKEKFFENVAQCSTVDFKN